MGNKCCGESDPKEDDKELALITGDANYEEIAPLQLNRNMKLLIRRIRNVLSVIIPEMGRLFPDTSDHENSKHLIRVVDKVIAQQDSTMSELQRLEVINRSTNIDFRGFRNRLYQESKQLGSGEGQRKRRASTVNEASRSELARVLTLWFEADADCSGSLSESEVKTLLARINIEMSSGALRRLLREVDSSENGQLEFFEFLTLYERITTVEDLISVFQLYATGTDATHSPAERSLGTNSQFEASRSVSGVISEESLRRFLVEEQKETDETIAHAIKMFGAPRVVDGKLGINFRQFQAGVINHNLNTWMHPRENEVHMDMTQPYTHYFIDSSHNTYLSGHQLTGQSTCDMYSQAMLDGCRCVELDCWDGPDNDPIVTHGHTLTSTIRFYDVCKTLNETAFVRSPYPVCLSLEIHTSATQQDVMVSMMKEIFKDRLTDAAMAERSDLHGKEFSPEGLKFKFLVKAKRLAGAGLDGVSGTVSPDAESPSSTPAASPKAGKAAGGHVVATSLSNATYVASTKFKSCAEAMKMPHYYVASVDEVKVEKWSREPHDMIEVTKGFIIRVYPKGTRCDSSNFSPQFSWNIGAQMIAMNIQTQDEGNRLNRYKFRQNGQCGFILKPPSMREPTKCDGPLGRKGTRVLTVKVLCALQLPKPGGSKTGEVIDPFVELFVCGSGMDDTSTARRTTQVIDDNGFNPRWGETFSFTVNTIEVANLHMRVLEKDPLGSEFIGDNAIPLESLREGYRAVPLFMDREPLPAPTCLLCHFSFGEGDSWLDINDQLSARTLRTPSQKPGHAASLGNGGERSGHPAGVDKYTEQRLDML